MPSNSGKKGKEPAQSTTKKHDRIDSDSDSDDGSIQLSFYSDSDARGTKKSKVQPPRKSEAIRVMTPGSGKRREKPSFDLSDSDEDETPRKKRRRKSSQSSQSENDDRRSSKEEKKSKVQLKVTYLNVSCLINEAILFTTRKDAFLETRRKSPGPPTIVTALAKQNVIWTDDVRAPSPRRLIVAAGRKRKRARYN